MALIPRTILVERRFVTVMDMETLQSEVECLLTSGDVDQLSEVGCVLKMRKDTLAGLPKLNLLKRVHQKLEEVIEAGKLKETKKSVSDTKKKYEA